MRLGIAILAHGSLFRAGQLAADLARQGAAVALHVDRASPAHEVARLQMRLTDYPDVMLLRRYRCAWGRWSLVAAAQRLSEELLLRNRNLTHVALISGDTLPLRSFSEIEACLTEDPTRDFIESVDIEVADWVRGGLSQDRFRLFHLLSWQRHPRLFSASVDLQRRIGVSRRLPDGLKPHLGAQWWCLSRNSLEAILNDPARRRHERFFRSVWIPDEAYFQSLIRKHSHRISAISPVHAPFDAQGRPKIFYDDHLPELRRSDACFARKIWSGADVLYQGFLSKSPQRARPLTEALPPRAARPRSIWAGPVQPSEWTVLAGWDQVFADLGSALKARRQLALYGRLFAPDRVDFGDGSAGCSGALSDTTAIRDWAPTDFLANLQRFNAGRRPAFCLAPQDDLSGLLAAKAGPGLRVSIIPGAWVLSALSTGLSGACFARRQCLEQKQIADLRASGGDLRIYSLAEVLADPCGHWQRLCSDLQLSPLAMPEPLTWPLPRIVTQLTKFRDAGLNPGMLPDLVGLLNHRQAEDLPGSKRV